MEKTKYLFFYAHPDDESAGAATTINKLVQSGNEVMVVLATAGAAGDCVQKGRFYLQDENLANTRKSEFDKEMKFLGVQQYKILDYEDGNISNSQVWGDLQKDFIKIIEGFKPNVVISFDPTGWYGHLDHIAVGMTVRNIMRKTQHNVDLYLYNVMRNYDDEDIYEFTNFPEQNRYFVQVDKETKIQTIKCHVSQLNSPVGDFIKKLEKENNPIEMFVKIFSNHTGDEIIQKSDIFELMIKN